LHNDVTEMYKFSKEHKTKLYTNQGQKYSTESSENPNNELVGGTSLLRSTLNNFTLLCYEKMVWDSSIWEDGWAWWDLPKPSFLFVFVFPYCWFIVLRYWCMCCVVDKITPPRNNMS